MQGMETLLARKAEISSILTGAQVEKEEHWVTCLVPGLPSEYPDYFEGTKALTAAQVAEEFEFQTKIKPLQSRWARMNPGSSTATLVLAFPRSQLQACPAECCFWMEQTGDQEGP
jgi:hypothetical protein